MRQLFTFLGGLAIGYLFSIVPALIEVLSGLDQCIESCPGWFKAFSWSTYAALPLAWGTALAILAKKQLNPAQKRALLVFAAVSAALGLFIAFYGYAYQARLL
jgi:NADPH:quinone reductase-like Zn-dependent oxidoreductase